MAHPYRGGPGYRRPGFSRWVVIDLPGVTGEFTAPPGDPPIWAVKGTTTLRIRHCTAYRNGVSATSYRVHDQTMENLKRGFLTRVWRYKNADPIPTQPSSAHHIRKFLTAFRAYPVQPWSYEKVLEHTLPRRKLVYGRAIESLRCKPLQRRDSYVSTFIKAEKFNATLKPNADPRLIQPRTARFLAAHAKYIKAVEPHVYKALSRLQQHPMVAKGYNAESTAALLREKWDMFRRPVCLSLDASRFDQHVSRDMLKFCHGVYRKFFKHLDVSQREELRMLSEWQLLNRGYARCPEGSFTYEVEGRRMSGDMDTSLGNCLIMCMMTRSLLDSLGIRGQIFNNGDDCLIIMEEDDAPDAKVIREFYHQFGFHVIEEDRVNVFEKVLFCQAQPVWAGRWVMCRHPQVINKDLTYIGPQSANRLWLDAIGQCGLALSDGVPVLSTFYKTLLLPKSKISGIKNSMLYSCGMTRLAEGMTVEDRTITEQARMSFYLAFGIAPEDQVAIESSMGPLGDIYDSSEIEHTTLLDYICYGEKTKTKTTSQNQTEKSNAEPGPGSRIAPTTC